MNEVEKFKKKRKEKTSKKEQNEVVNLYMNAIGDPYARNRMINDVWRKYAEENKVTGLKSLIHELELRWKATPGLGGLPEGPSLWDEINRPQDFSTPLKWLEKLTK